MKKLLLIISLSLLSFKVIFAQGYYYIKESGTNPAEYNPRNSGANTTIVIAAETTVKTKVLSSIQKMPFNWKFYGSTVSSYKVSSSGYLTFDTTLKVDENNNVALPSISAPNSSIFAFWDNLKVLFASGVNTTFPQGVRSWTYGAAPNRVHVVQWQMTQKDNNAANLTNISQFAIRFYEAGDATKFDIVHNFGAGNFDATVGVQGTDPGLAKQVTGSPNLNYGGETGGIDPELEVVYNFYYGVQPNQDVFLKNAVIFDIVEKGKNQNISFDIQNLGKNDLSALKINYSIDGAAAVTGQLADLNTANSGGLESFDLPSPITFATSGKKSIKVWVSNPNNLVDQNNSNDTLVISTEVFDKLFPRKALHEIFTSSTCPPCKPGNEKLSEVINANTGKWNVIKYQVNFPGTGDPYYTSEVGTRFSYYGANSAPHLAVDGGYNGNANFYSQKLFDGFALKGSLVEIKASHTISGNTITVSGTVTPNQANTTTNLKLRIAIVENRTEKNVKSNGETEFFNVMKKMLPNAAGTALSLSAGTPVSFNQSYTVPGSYRLPSDGQTANIINLATENSVEVMGNLFAVVFVEDDTKKEVWQSEASNVVFPLSVKNENKNDAFTIFPNPAQNNFNIEFTKSVNGTVKVLDLSGKLVLNTNINSMNETVDCSNLNNGLYIVKIEANGVVYTQKLNIAK